MTRPAEPITSATRRPSPALVAVLRALKPGQRIEVTQTVRVGSKVWKTTVRGTFRAVNYLATGLSTDRVPEDDIVVPTVHFIKDPHGELSSICLDENSDIKPLER
jgi:hypothetical protein